METESIIFNGDQNSLSDAVIPSLLVPEVKSEICILSIPAAIPDKKLLDNETILLRRVVV